MRACFGVILALVLLGSAPSLGGEADDAGSTAGPTPTAAPRSDGLQPSATPTLAYVPGIPAIQPQVPISTDLTDLSITPDQAVQYVLQHGTSFESPSFEVDTAFCAAAATLRPWIEPPSGRPDDAPLCVVQARGQFANHHVPAGVPIMTGDHAYVVFDGHTGNLLSMGCCAALALPLPSPAPVQLPGASTRT